MSRTTIGAALIAVLASCTTSGTTVSPSRDVQHMLDIDKNPNLYFRIDNFVVPDAAREEFVAAMHRNLAFIKARQGFLGHVVFEKTGGPTAFNIATIAVWENKEAADKASVEVRAYYQKIGFDMTATIARWGVKAEIGTFSAPRELQ
jgi:hypothetical protein